MIILFKAHFYFKMFKAKYLIWIIILILYLIYILLIIYYYIILFKAQFILFPALFNAFSIDFALGPRLYIKYQVMTQQINNNKISCMEKKVFTKLQSNRWIWATISLNTSTTKYMGSIFFCFHAWLYAYLHFIVCI